MFTKSNSSKGIHEINITPFVDIVLVLLIIFMVSTPAMIYQGLKVRLPHAINSADISHVTLRVTLTKEGELKLDGQKSNLEAIKRAFLSMKESTKPSDAVVLADAEVPHGKVIELSDELRSIGIEQIGFGTSNKGKR